MYDNAFDAVRGDNISDGHFVREYNDETTGHLDNGQTSDDSELSGLSENISDSDDDHMPRIEGENNLTRISRGEHLDRLTQAFTANEMQDMYL